MGRAWGASRIGCLGFQRYSTFPSSNSTESTAEAAPKRSKRNHSAALGSGKRGPISVDVLTYRCCKTVVHEVLHCFLLDHCVAAECLMNTTGSLDEDFRAPLRLCIADLQKLVYATGCDIVQRYQDLLRLFEQWPGFEDEARQLNLLLQAAHKDRGSGKAAQRVD